MLNAVGVFNIHAPSSSSLRLRSNNILDLYFQLFLQEVEYLMQRGLIKKYRKTEGNTMALKGSLHFAKHIQQNLTHQERFYVRHTTYDKEHRLHQILRKALVLLSRINTNTALNSNIGALMLNFPEVADVSVSETNFQRLAFHRKTEPYRNAIEIAKLLLLNYHPDVNRGRENVLALMFDMNALWEQFVYVSLRKNKDENTTIQAQNSKLFWKKVDGNYVKMRPDIVIQTEAGTAVLDTKWKNLNGKNPSPDDLRQMYVYHQYFDADKVALVYPGDSYTTTQGHYAETDSELLTQSECAVIQLGVETNIQMWQEDIGKYFEKMFR
jgi:5-methylcytosine-specific restriction enzyme subunit McrC